MAGKYWREAATLMLIGKSNIRPVAKLDIKHDILPVINKDHKDLSSNHNITNYNLLCLKRSSKSSFMPNCYVFPGGVIDNADKSIDWMSILLNHGYSEQHLLDRFRFSQGRPFLYSNRPEKELLPELAFRICALRETFEETGVLLASSDNKIEGSSLVSLDDSERKKWMGLVQNDARKFLELFENLKKIPAIFDLHEWDGWLTPSSFKGLKRRFDTVFFTSFLDQEIPLYHHSIEAEELKVETPYNLLRSYYDGKLIIEPPQIYEFGRLLNFSDWNELKKFSEERSKINLPRWCPVITFAKDGFISHLPGDDMYPANPDYIGEEEETRTIDSTMEESRKVNKNLNRFEIRMRKTTVLFSNISPDGSHVIPKTPFCQPTQEAKRSKL